MEMTKSFIISSLFISIKAQEVAQWRGPERNGIYNEVGLLKKWPDKDFNCSQMA
jgi:hypothetical protein